jgi:flagellar biogenesis protein FliO
MQGNPFFGYIRSAFCRLSRPQKMLLGAGLLIAAGGYAMLWTAGAASSDGAPTSLTAVDLIAKLLIVLGLIYLSARALRSLAGKSLTNGGKRAVDVLEVTHLANNRSLYLINVADRVLLLGATQSHISTLTQIDDPVSLAALRHARSKSSTSSFSSLLKRAESQEDRP